MTLYIDDALDVPFTFDYRKTARRVVEACLSSEAFPLSAEISMTLVTPAEIQQMNHSFRGLDKPTDVLSFPLITFLSAGDYSNIPKDSINPDTGEAILGDIVICVDYVCLQAKAYGHSEEREFAFLTAHSMFHLLGYDHEEDGERLVMEEKEERVLQSLGILR